HRREVERRDAGAHAERLPDRVDVDARRGLLREAPLQELRHPAAELDHLEPARHLAERVREDLAVLGGEELRDVLTVLVEEASNSEEDLGAARQRQRPPARERLTEI